MKTKQLANVLIKILGLSVIVQGVPIILSGLLSMLQFGGVGSGGAYNYFLHLLPTLIMVAIGIYLLVKSRAITAALFKDEDE